MTKPNILPLPDNDSARFLDNNPVKKDVQKILKSFWKIIREAVGDKEQDASKLILTICMMASKRNDDRNNCLSDPNLGGDPSKNELARTIGVLVTKGDFLVEGDDRVSKISEDIRDLGSDERSKSLIKNFALNLIRHWAEKIQQHQKDQQQNIVNSEEVPEVLEGSRMDMDELNNFIQKLSMTDAVENSFNEAPSSSVKIGAERIKLVRKLSDNSAVDSQEKRSRFG